MYKKQKVTLIAAFAPRIPKGIIGCDSKCSAIKIRPQDVADIRKAKKKPVLIFIYFNITKATRHEAASARLLDV